MMINIFYLRTNQKVFSVICQIQTIGLMIRYRQPEAVEVIDQVQAF